MNLLEENYKSYLFLINFFVFTANLVNSEILFDGSNKYFNTTKSGCSLNSLYSWQCDSGQCIQMEELCDGIANCADKSDETVEHCLHKPCPEYAFKCAYGGCITGAYKCNAILDCVDGSDETRFLCDSSLNYSQEIKGSCWLSANMQCKSGDCISSEKACDGVRDCSDGSDETVELCSFLNCPEYAFRCGYGACIAGSAKCNGIVDCLDASDESPGFCGSMPSIRNTTTTLSPAYFPTLLPRPATQPPTRPVIRYTQPATTTTTAIPRTTQTPTLLPTIRPSNTIKYCDANILIRGISTITTCSLNNNPVSCYHSLHVGTEAKVTCASGYMREHPPAKGALTLVCDADGEWTRSKYKCYPKCGELTESQRKSVIKPWDVTIAKRSYTPIYQALCSGVIVSPKIVVTAANCLQSTDGSYETDHVFYNIIEGFYNFTYSDGNRLSAAVHNVSKISIKTSPKSHDLAILVLVNYFRFTNYIRPICLPTIRQNIAILQDERLDVGRAVTRDTNREYLEFIIAKITKTGRSDLDQRTTNIEYIRINDFVPFIVRAIKQYRHIL